MNIYGIHFFLKPADYCINLLDDDDFEIWSCYTVQAEP